MGGRIKILLVLVFVLSAGLLVCQTKSGSNPEQGKKFRILFSLGSFHSAKPQDAKAISQIFRNHIKESEQRMEDLEIIVVEDSDEILRQAKTGFDLIIMTSKEYYDLKKTLPLEPTIINQTGGIVGYKYYLLVHKNENIKEVGQLKGSTINILGRAGQNASVLWINKLLKDKKLPNKEKFFKEINYDFKVTNIILPVFFNKVRAALVTEHGYKLVSELNPQISRDMHILVESDPIALGLGCMNALEKDPARKKFLTNVLLNLHKTNYGKQIFDFFGTDQIIPYKPEYMTEFLQLMDK